MFKGLRAKIESEQRGQAGRISNSNNKQTISQERGLLDSHSEAVTRIPIIDDTTLPSNHFPISSSQTVAELRSDSIDRPPTRQQEVISTTNHEQGSLDATPTDNPNNDPQVNDKDDIHNLKSRISSLEDQLSTVIREKDEINDQNAQLYHLIEKLRRNLETESETRSGLQVRLAELTNQLTDKAETGPQKPKTDTALNKSFNPTPDPNISHDVEALRNEVNELQVQLAKKNRQLKICQQNLTDLKKTLQKEILDNSNAQKELSRLKEQLKASDQLAERGHQNHSKDKILTSQDDSNN